MSSIQPSFTPRAIALRSVRKSIEERMKAAGSWTGRAMNFIKGVAPILVPLAVGKATSNALTWLMPSLQAAPGQEQSWGQWAASWGMSALPLLGLNPHMLSHQLSQWGVQSIQSTGNVSRDQYQMQIQRAVTEYIFERHPQLTQDEKIKAAAVTSNVCMFMFEKQRIDEGAVYEFAEERNVRLNDGQVKEIFNICMGAGISNLPAPPPSFAPMHGAASSSFPPPLMPMQTGVPHSSFPPPLVPMQMPMQGTFAPVIPSGIPSSHTGIPSGIPANLPSLGSMGGAAIGGMAMAGMPSAIASAAPDVDAEIAMLRQQLQEQQQKNDGLRKILAGGGVKK